METIIIIIEIAFVVGFVAFLAWCYWNTLTRESWDAEYKAELEKKAKSKKKTTQIKWKWGNMKNWDKKLMQYWH